MEQTLPEYARLRESKLATEDEIRELVKRREKFFWTLSRNEKKPSHYIDFLEYERMFIVMLYERKKYAIHVVRAIETRIKGVYDEFVKRFPDHENSWDMYIDFMNRCAEKNDAATATVFDAMLNFHGHNPLVWLKYIQWERNVRKSPDNCRSLFLRGLQRLPDCEKLYLHYMDLELENSQERSEEKILETITILYNSLKEKVAGIGIRLRVLELVERSGDYLKSFVHQVMTDLKNDFANDEQFWQCIAQRELYDKELYGPKAENEKPLTVKERIRKYVQVYQTAVSKIPTTKMWDYYLNAVTDLNADGEPRDNLRRRVLGRAFKDADESGLMSLEYYKKYIEILKATNASPDIILKVILNAKKLNGNDPEVWSMHLQYCIDQNDDTGALAVFNEAKKRLEAQSYIIWNQYYRYLHVLDNGKSKRILNFFEDVIREENAVFNDLKAEFIEWSNETSNLDYARKQYRRVLQISKPCLEVHNKMAAIESRQTEAPNKAAWRKCLEAAALQFGPKNVDVWLKLINFELTHGDAKAVSRIHAEAVNKLHKDMKNEFTMQRCKMQEDLALMAN